MTVYAGVRRLLAERGQSYRALTVPALARALGVSRSYCQRWLAGGECSPPLAAQLREEGERESATMQPRLRLAIAGAIFDAWDRGPAAVADEAAKAAAAYLYEIPACECGQITCEGDHE